LAQRVSISLDRVRRHVNETEAKKLAEIRDEFAATKSRFLDLLAMTSLISVSSRRSEAARLTLRPRLERAIRCFDLIKRSYGIDIDIDHVSGTVQVGPMLEAELFAVLLNVLSNSIKSVIAAGGRKRVMVVAERRDCEIVLNVRDSGIGLEKKYFEQVFAPFVADPDRRLYRGLDAKLNPEDQYIVGTGSGLGLSIAREILSYRGGAIRFVTPHNEWKADVEIVMP
jgi:signal transduction histidine kinase